MTSKPEGDEHAAITIGPNTRVNFMGVTIISLLAGLCVGAWSASAAFWRLNANIDKKVTRSEFTRWTLEFQQANRGSGITVPIYVPPRDSSETDGGGR